MTQQQPQNELKKTMKSRHLFMISLGGVIGTGFFLGSGYSIGQAGAIGAILSFIVGGMIMYLTMLCLGELSVAMPVSGSFQTYTTKFVGPGFGFAFGWVYWLGWAVTVALDFLSAGQLMQRWFPDIPTWIWIAIFALVLFALNSLSAKAFGETEFWFAGIKILVILIFIILGAGAMFGIVPLSGHKPAPFFHNYVSHGLFPHGITAVLVTMITVNFSFQGTELIGVAAGESENPDKTIPRAIKQTAVRTIVLFVLPVAILGGLLPIEQAGVVTSPFVTVFDSIGIPYAADIMNVVILTALLSAANSGLYASTRMMYALAKDKMAHRVFMKVNKRGVPMAALILTLLIALLSLLSSVVAAKTVYVWLISAAGFSAEIGWITITGSLLLFRRKYVKHGGKVSDLKFKVPLYPILPFLAFLLNIVVLVSMAFDSEQRMALYCGVPLAIFCFIYYHLRVKKKVDLNIAEQEIQLKDNKTKILS